MENLNVVEILKIGLPGLVFLLAFLSFNLLSKEQGKSHPRPTLLKAIKCYMYVNIVLAILTMASPIIEYFLPRPTLPDSMQFSIKAKVTPTITIKGQAAVCQNVEYVNRYMLLKDQTTGERMVQVKATNPIPCTGEDYILVNQFDALTLGWTDEVESHVVEVATAPLGYQFPN